MICFSKEVCTLSVLLLFLAELNWLPVCPSVCLFVCGQHYSKGYERIVMKFWGVVLGGTMKNWLNYSGDLGLQRWVSEQKNIIAVTWPDRGAGSDPEPLGLATLLCRVTWLSAWLHSHNRGGISSVEGDWGLAFHHQNNAIHSNIVALWHNELPW